MRIESFYRKIVIFLLMLVPGKGMLFAQSDYQKVYREILFADAFEVTTNKWPLPQGRWENGALIISDRLNMESPKTACSIPVDDSRDFEIELTASPTSAVLPAQIHWNNYVWELIAEQRSSVFINGSLVKSFSTRPGKNSSNKYTIRRSGNTFYYFIDEKNVGSTAFVKGDNPGKLAIGFSGKINIDDLRISYTLKEGPPVTQNNGEDQRTTTANAESAGKKQEIKAGGRFFALIIGVSRYNEPKLYLENPEKDAVQVRSIFTTRYSFEDSTTFLLLNPTRQKIIAELYRLRKVIGPNDNLLIFYAGHGYWDKEAKQGYWWAKDAARDDPSTWLSNSDLREQIRSIKSAHTLLISDACFSGGIFRTRGADDLMNASKDIQVLYKMPSRRAITSGTMTTVPDNSVFLEYFLKRLRDNQAPFLSSQQLFDSFRTSVINNSSTVPQDGVIAETGDEGGDFIFILKKK